MKLTDPIFTDEAKARTYFETIRWPNGPFCPHCGETDKVYRLDGKAHRPGLIHCNGCKGSFTVTTGGVMESSHIPLTKWALAFYLYAASKKGFSANQLHRQLGISYKSAWFMAHRVREAMGPAADAGPMGGAGKTIEADEMYLGKSPKTKRSPGRRTMKVVSLVERGGVTRSRKIENADRSEIRAMLDDNVADETRIVTDTSQLYRYLPVALHESVDHSKKEYVRGDVHTNTLEGYFSVFKRGLVGTYQHMSEQHLQRYLNEFDFRQSNRAALGVNDTMRAERAIMGAEGKRLTYHQTGEQAGA
jgi:transposase-like protein